MLEVTLYTGARNILPDSLPVSMDNFGYNYTSFRPFGRFLRQTEDDPVGLISWPGGSLAENAPDRYGLGYDDLWNDRFGFGLEDVFAAARARDAGVSIVLPTLPYLGREEDLQADVSRFIDRLSGGDFGPLSRRLILEVGSEYYATFGPGVESATTYGRLAEATVQALAGALADPQVNPGGILPEIAVQSGLSLEEDAAIRAELGQDSLRHVDLLIHHRFPLLNGGVDDSAEALTATTEAWEQDMAAVGAPRPGVFLSSYNVASLTREEALGLYVETQSARGITVDPANIDLTARSDTGFERFWQDQMHLRDYGQEQPRVLMELHARVGAVGMEAASAYGIDLIHPGRLSFADAAGQAQDFIGQETLDMLAESTLDTRLLKMSLRNRATNDLWSVAYENDDKLVAFVGWEDQPPGPVNIRVPGLMKGDYLTVRAESLTAAIPEDWMALFGIPDNPDVDESPESHAYALGLRAGVDLRAVGGNLRFQATAEDQMVRLVFAKTAAGEAEIAGWATGDPLTLLPEPEEVPQLEEPPVPPPVVTAPPPVMPLPPVPMPEDSPDDPPEAADSGDGTDIGGVLGGALLALGLFALAL